MKGCQFFRKYVYSTTHTNPFVLGIVSPNKLRKRIFYIVDNVIVVLPEDYTIFYALC